MIHVYFETYGCSASFSNAEIMKALLIKSNFYIVDSINDADVVVINTCIVKSPTETKMWRRLKAFSLLNKRVVVAGCMPEVYASKIRELYPNYSLLGPRNIDKIVEVIKDIMFGKIDSYLGKQNLVKTELPEVKHNEITSIVQISDGCLGDCAYCSVKFAKGRLFSYPIESIINRVKSAIDYGSREIWITSQDNSAYGIDFSQSKKSKLPVLLSKLSSIEGSFFVRVGMMNPEHIVPVASDLVDAFESNKIFKFIHIPVQSGNDRVLKLMNRRYSVEDFKKIVRIFRATFPNISISTDVICGFPTETEEEFNDTLELIKDIKPAVLNISRFWPRPLTVASKLKQVDGAEIKRRSKLMTTLFSKISRESNKSWLGWSGKVLIDEFNSKTNTFLGRNYVYKPIIIKSDNIRLGDIVNVKVTGITEYDLVGKVVS